MSQRVQQMRSSLLAGTSSDWQMFHRMIADRIVPGMRILEVGCGRGSICPFPWDKYTDRYLVGIDPDPTAAANPYLDRFVLLRDSTDLRRWPLDGQTFDLIIARYVLEHVETSGEFLANIKRALKPGGEFLFLTPNLLHPAVAVSHILPVSLKHLILSATKQVDSADVFPTHYRLNTPGFLGRQLRACGLQVKDITVCEPQPVGYLDFSVPTFLAAYYYYRCLKWSGLEHRFGVSIFGVVGQD
jgi:SAM-dependent methyltransferase